MWWLKDFTHKQNVVEGGKAAVDAARELGYDNLKLLQTRLLRIKVCNILCMHKPLVVCHIISNLQYNA